MVGLYLTKLRDESTKLEQLGLELILDRHEGRVVYVGARLG